jgi:hypothetical protein
MCLKVLQKAKTTTKHYDHNGKALCQRQSTLSTMAIHFENYSKALRKRREPLAEFWQHFRTVLASAARLGCRRLKQRNAHTRENNQRIVHKAK